MLGRKFTSTSPKNWMPKNDEQKESRFPRRPTTKRKANSRMTNLRNSLVRQYDDGPDWPTTDERQQAERAYRDAFLHSARQAAHWKSIDKEAIARAWEERRRVRRQAEVLISSADCYGNPNLTGQQVLYRRQHLVDASRTRGCVHGFEFVRQCWEALRTAGVDEKRIAPEIIRPWLQSVAEWVATEIRPDRFDTPRMPDQNLAERQRLMLNQAKAVIANSNPAHPELILRRLTDITREELEWLWPARIPLGKLTLLAGDPGLGKSFVTLDLAARVSRGGCWPDTPIMKQKAGNVILLNCEDDVGDTIAPRLDKCGADDSKVIILDGVKLGEHRRQFSLEIDLPRLETALEQFDGTRLVVIDPIAAYCGNVDSHKNSDVRGMLAPLAEMASRHRVAILAVTHLSKSGGAKAVYRAMGSLAFAAAARAVWAITKDADDSERRLFLPAKLNLARDPTGLAYRIEDSRVVWDDLPVSMHADDAIASEYTDKKPTKRGSEREEAAAWLLEFLASGEVPATEVTETGTQFGFSDRTIRRAYKEVGAKPRKQSFDGPWLWSLPNSLFTKPTPENKSVTPNEDDQDPPSV